ncbi:MAG: hypothetical protein HY776_02675 [Actinobacteria bacterium]|nr:hypothetical protein [Actinomycetota bacterium]
MTIDERLKDEHVDSLFEAILLLGGIEECYQFFEDLCTVNELKALAQRFAVAKSSPSYSFRVFPP